MRAIVVDAWMEPEALRVSEIEEPKAEPGMLQVDVKAAGCNFFDILLVQGKYQLKPPFPFTPGAEIAGVVRTVGEGVTGFAPGDRVMASLPLGAFAEVVNAPPMVTAKIPDKLSFIEGAAFPIVYPTSHAALVYRAHAQPGETVLISAAAGGVGLSSLQIAKALGCKVIALAGGEEKLAVAREAGADVAIDYSRADWVDQVRAANGARGVDVVIENVGGDIFEGCMKLLAWGGRLIVVGFAGGKIPEVRVNRILLKHVAVIGLHWGQMILHEPHNVLRAQRELAELVEQDKIRPKVWKAFPLEQASQALAAIASRQSWGKVVLTMGD